MENAIARLKVPPSRFELETANLVGWCSIRLSYGGTHKNKKGETTASLLYVRVFSFVSPLGRFRAFLPSPSYWLK